MQATTAVLVQFINPQQRCGACRYFQQDRCGNASARIAGEDSKTGDCPYFRFFT